jgi:cbb3-type cytochrome oxidase subunit 3
MFVLSIAGILIAMILAAYWRDRREQERYERRQSLIRWYTDDSHKSERVK